MPIRQNTWDLKGHYDLTNSGQNAYLGAPILFAWGQNGKGQLGQNNTTYRSSPVQIPGITWGSISIGYFNTLATKTDGTLWSWGYNNLGALGQNNRTYYSSPVQIPGTTWNSVNSGYHSLATKTDGTLWAWGSGTWGQLGQNNGTSYSSPVQIPGTTWSSVRISNEHSLASKTDGTLWAWGNNLFGQLGQTNTTRYSSPVQIPGTTWSSISTGAASTLNALVLATKTDGTLWSWGSGTSGQLGQNNVVSRSSPVQIPGTAWSSISASSSGLHSLATKTDGTLWSWGLNQYGQLGQNSRVSQSSPVQIPGTTWSSIGAGGYDALATKTNNTLWSWGENIYGQLGQNNTTNISSPVQIPGTQWTSMSIAYRSSFVLQQQ